MDKKKIITDYLIITIGCFILALGIDKFYAPHNLVTGGFSGLSIIISYYSTTLFGVSIPISLINLFLNLPVFIIAFFVLGFNMVFRSFYSTIMVTVGLFVMTLFPTIETDIFISAVFGAVFAGIGLGLVFSRQSTTGGTDLVCTIINKFLKQKNISKLLFILDSSIILLGLFAFGIENCMYAIISVFVCTKVINIILEGIGFAEIVYIITDKSDEVSAKIFEVLDKGVTGIESRGMYTGTQRVTLMTVMPSKSIPKLKEITKEIDKNAFIIVSEAREVFGEGFAE